LTVPEQSWHVVDIEGQIDAIVSSLNYRLAKCTSIAKLVINVRSCVCYVRDDKGTSTNAVENRWHDALLGVDVVIYFIGTEALILTHSAERVVSILQFTPVGERHHDENFRRGNAAFGEHAHLARELGDGSKSGNSLLRA
jgi:hypothetical protein